MNSIKKCFFILTLTFSYFRPELQAQQTDTLKKYQDTTAHRFQSQPFFKKKLVKASIAPVILIGYGLSTIKDKGIYSSYQAQRDLQRNFPGFQTSIDDYLIYAPFAELIMAYALQVKGNHDFLNTGILIVKAEAINAALVFGFKSITKQERPDGSNSYSLPSGHTAHAFMAASIIHNELRHRSQWYGIGAYTIATSVGAFRMLNNKHWQSDVFAGAGVGILSSHLAYLSHRNRWGQKPSVSFNPTYLFGSPAIALSIDLHSIKRQGNTD